MRAIGFKHAPNVNRVGRVNVFWVSSLIRFYLRCVNMCLPSIPKWYGRFRSEIFQSRVAVFDGLSTRNRLTKRIGLLLPRKYVEQLNVITSLSFRSGWIMAEVHASLRGEGYFVNKFSVFSILCFQVPAIRFHHSNKVLQDLCITRDTFLFITADVICDSCQEILGNPFPHKRLCSNHTSAHGFPSTIRVFIIFWKNKYQKEKKKTTSSI